MFRSVILILNFVAIFNLNGISAFNPTLHQLGKHNVYQNQVTMSGFSSGGTFAQSMQITHSNLISGIASFSHAYYRCGPGNGIADDYDNACTIIGTNQTYNYKNSLNDISSYERNGLIEPTRNLRNKKLYVYAGASSQLFSIEQSLGVISVFEPLIQNPMNIRTRVQNAAQLLPSDRFGNSCTASAERNFFIGNCGLNGAAEALSFLLGDYAVQYPSKFAKPNLNQLLPFDQTEFFHGYNGPEFMDSRGFIYLPRQCSKKTCYLHFYFHGCFTGFEFNGTQHIVNSGFLEVAEENDIIAVFPQALRSLPQNEIGCWDTYGLTGRNYATKRGAQITVVRNILARILGLDKENDYDYGHYSNHNHNTARNTRNNEQPKHRWNFEVIKGREVYSETSVFPKHRNY